MAFDYLPLAGDLAVAEAPAEEEEEEDLKRKKKKKKKAKKRKEEPKREDPPPPEEAAEPAEGEEPRPEEAVAEEAAAAPPPEPKAQAKTVKLDVDTVLRSTRRVADRRALGDENPDPPEFVKQCFDAARKEWEAHAPQYIDGTVG